MCNNKCILLIKLVYLTIGKTVSVLPRFHYRPVPLIYATGPESIHSYERELGFCLWAHSRTNSHFSFKHSYIIK